jgi:hypothetical protein
MPPSKDVAAARIAFEDVSEIDASADVFACLHLRVCREYI